MNQHMSLLFREEHQRTLTLQAHSDQTCLVLTVCDTPLSQIPTDLGRCALGGWVHQHE